ncbi:MAG: hypothetical protein MUE73_18860 [Planctomycetes bacterium]|jgi:hypothetical protein|nr:hypothetical protein [Planctomycetota bacterium]
MRAARPLFLLLAVLAPPVVAEEGVPPPFDLRLAHLHDGLRGPSGDRDLGTVGETKVGKLAAKVGLDLGKPENPLLACRFADGRLFYLFYKVTENAFADRPYVLQRIRKTERSWTAPEGPPEETVTFQVEVFKTLAGTLKAEDEHYGSFSLRDAARREIVKEYEVGFGEVPGKCEGREWPFAANTLFQCLEPYGEEAGLFETVKFSSSRKWALTVAFAADGTWRVRSDALGFDAPERMPDPAAAAPRPDPASAEVVLTAGRGLPGVTVGETTAEGLVAALGAPWEDAPAGKGHRVLSFAKSLTVNLRPDGILNTIITRSGFAGKTAEGIAHGDTRGRVLDLLGAPPGAAADAPAWRYPGLQVTFDGFDRVSRLVVMSRN